MARALAIGGWLSAWALSASGCAPIQEVTTEVRLRDPSAVSLAAASGETLVPPTPEPVDAPLAKGRASLGNGASAAYAVHARREDDRSLSVEWQTSLPLGNGERHTVVPADGALVLRQPLDMVIAPWSPTATRLHFDWCTTLRPGFARGILTAYAVEAHGCTKGAAFREGGIYAPTATVPYSLDTPWANVVEIRERTRVDHAAGWAVFGLTTALFGGLAAVGYGVPRSVPTKVAVGTPFAALGLAFDIMIFPTLVMPSHDVVIGR